MVSLITVLFSLFWSLGDLNYGGVRSWLNGALTVLFRFIVCSLLYSCLFCCCYSLFILCCYCSFLFIFCLFCSFFTHCSLFCWSVLFVLFHFCLFVHCCCSFIRWCSVVVLLLFDIKLFCSCIVDDDAILRYSILFLLN